MQLLRSLLEISQRNHFGADHEVVQYRPGHYLVRYNGDFYLEYCPDTSGKYSSIDVHWDGHWFYARVPDIVSALSDKSQVIYVDAEHPELSGDRARIEPNSQEAKWLFDFYHRVVQPMSQDKQPEDGISLGESVGAARGKSKVYDSATLTDHGSWIEITQPPRQFSIATSEVQQAMSGSTGVLKLQPEDVDHGPTVIKVTDQLAKDLFDFVGSHGETTGQASTEQLNFTINNMHELAPPSIEFDLKGGIYHVSTDDLHDAISKRQQSVHAAFMHKHGVDDTTLNLNDEIGSALIQFAKQNGLLESAPGKVMERVVNTPDITNGNKTAKIDYHTELTQYRVRLFVDGKFENDSTHYEDSPKEALAVARKMVGLVK